MYLEAIGTFAKLLQLHLLRRFFDAHKSRSWQFGQIVRVINDRWPFADENRMLLSTE